MTAESEQMVDGLLAALRPLLLSILDAQAEGERTRRLLESLVEPRSAAGLTTTQAAALLGLHPKTVRGLIQRRKLAATRGDGPHAQYRIARSDLEDYRAAAAVEVEQCPESSNVRPMFQAGRGRKPRGSAR